jgi:hypothetical protein
MRLAWLTALDQVVTETGATANQVVLAWLIGGELPVVPLIGASSVADPLAVGAQPPRAGRTARPAVTGWA